MARVLVALFLAFSLPACRPSPPPSVLRIGLPGTLPSLDPHASSDFVSSGTLANAYEGLVSLDADLRLAPALAVHWETPEESTWRFHLRSGVRFHGGQTLTAPDVVASFERARASRGEGVATFTLGVRSVGALDPATIEIRTDGPDPALLNRIASVAIVPRGSPARIEESSGTGPYRIRRLGPEVELEAFPHYWGPAPAIARVRLVPTGAPEERRRRALAADLDILPELAPAEARELAGSPGIGIVARPSATVTYLQMAVDRPPFSDVRVRRAVAEALDRAALVAQIQKGFGRPAAQLVGPGILGFDPALAVPPRDLAAARRHLAAAGHGDGLEVALEYHEGRATAGLVEQLAEAGIHARAVPRPWDELLSRISAGQVGLLYGGFISDSGDGSLMFEALFHTPGGTPGLGDLNTTGYADPEVDALIEAARRKSRPDQRVALLQQVQQRVLAASPVVPVLNPDDLYLVRDGIEWQPRLDGRVLAASVRRRP